MSHVGVHCCCGMPVLNMVVPPSSPALSSWRKELGHPKCLGGVLCVSGPIGLSTEGSWD